DIESIIKRAWELNIIVLIDEAYGDYMTMQNSAISLIHKYNNFYVLKSFSKAYSLAGIRIGYLVGSSELMGLYSLVDDFLINRVALHVALKALNHKDYLKGTINRTRENKNELIGSFNKLKVLETAPEVPIFTVFTENESIDLYKALKDHGIETSSGFYNLGKNSVRIRIPETNATLVQILSNFEKTI
ncbi:MAG: aminotransferase class I/II-fold pyridoxal phosphate-dependent enzyme, partial [Tissierellaceae bacterium]